MPKNRKPTQKRETPPLPGKTRLSVTDAGMRIVRLLVGRPPQSMTELIAALDVTRTAITEQLNELVGCGYVEQTREKCDGRGRPRYLYTVTKAAMRDLFEGPQDIVCPAIWQSLKNRVDAETLEDIRCDVARVLADYYRLRLHENAPEARLREFAELLGRLGRMVELERKDDSMEFRSRSCPLFSMIEDTGSTCRIHLLTMRMVLGDSVSVKRIEQRDRHEQACCVFRIRENSSNGFTDRGKDI